MSAGQDARWRWTREGRTTPDHLIGLAAELTMAEAADLLDAEASKLLHMNVGDDFQDNWERIA